MKNKLLKCLSYYTLEDLLSRFGLSWDNHPNRSKRKQKTEYKTTFVLEIEKILISNHYSKGLYLSECIQIEPHSYCQKGEVDFFGTGPRITLNLTDQFKLIGSNKFRLTKSVGHHLAFGIPTEGMILKFHTLVPVEWV